MMLASFQDELMKISAVSGNAFLAGISASASAIGKPASIAAPAKAQGALKPITKPTNYTAVHNYPTTAATGAASGSKTVSPPPVRA
jgi:hypothetical protein